MPVGPAFLVFAGGRWRNLPESCGWAVARGGKFVELHPGNVRAALRRLQARVPSKARLGARLLSRKILQRPKDTQYKHIQNRDLQLSERNRDSSSSNESLHKIRPCKRKRDSTSSEQPLQTITTIATIHGSSIRKQPKNTSNPQINFTRKRQSSSEKSLSPVKLSRRELKRKGQNSEEIQELRSPRKNLSLKRKVPVNRKSTSKENSPILKSRVVTDKQITRYLKSRKHTGTPKETDNKRNLSSDNSDFETDTTDKSQHKRTTKNGYKSSKLGSTSQTPQNTGRNEILKVPSPKKDISGMKTPTLSHQLLQSQKYMCKELVIDEKDIEVLRNFLQNHYSDEDLLRFDMDDEYKKMHFFRINPLVNIEYCSQIAQIHRDVQKSQITLADFASKLGLRSISEASSDKPKRYKMRKTVEKKYVPERDSSSSDHSSDDKENNYSTDKRRNNNMALKESKESKIRESYVKDRNLKEKVGDRNTKDHKLNKKAEDRNRKELNVKDNTEDCNSKRDNTKQKAVDDTIETVDLSSDHEMEKEVVRKPVKKPKPFKPKPVISTKRGIHAYSNLEDHAIVAWLSQGARASRVNGNRLWRDLQDQFHSLCGNRRTWHSLRNRYLRYILPSLGALALPTGQQTRLRAAAATGELKTRKKLSSRRNSMFAVPARGAASRRPARGSPHGGAPAPQETEERPHRSPRYSSLTRQFTRRQNLRRPSSERSNQSTAHREPTEQKEKALTKEERPHRSPRYSSLTRQFTRRQNLRRPSSERSNQSTAHREPTEQKEKGFTKGNAPIKAGESITKSVANNPAKKNEVKNRSNRRESTDSDPSESDHPKESIGRTSRSLDASNTRKSRSESSKKTKSPSQSRRVSAGRQKPRELSNESKERKPLSESNKRRSRQSKTRNESKRNKSAESDRSVSSSDQSKKLISPSRRKNRPRSASEQSSSDSSESGSQDRWKSNKPKLPESKQHNTRNKRNKRRDSSKDQSSDSSSESVSLPPARKSGMIKSPTKSGRRISNRHKSPKKQDGPQSRDLSFESPGRKTNRPTRQSLIESSRQESTSKRRNSSNESKSRKLRKSKTNDSDPSQLRHPNDSRRKSGRQSKYKVGSLNELVVISDSDESTGVQRNMKKDPKKKVISTKLRRLFNPKAML